MEFVKTSSFWCPHIGRAACTNFSTRTVELRPSKRREILPFPSFSFLLSPLTLTLSFPSLSFFSFFFSLRTVFPFCSFLPFFLFPFCFPFIFLFSHLISLSFYLLNWKFLSHFESLLTLWVKGGNFLPISSSLMCGHQFSFFLFYSFFPFYDITLPCGSL